MMDTPRAKGVPVVSAVQLSKRFCRDLRRALWYGLQDIAGELFVRKQEQAAELRPAEFWALHDVSFELSSGDSLAIIGANGSGKSTLLKVIYGLIKPDAGSVSVAGRVGALIELGTGFSPVLSGRENIQLSAAVLGLSPREMQGLVEAIADFAELGTVLDTPLQYYSSGMRARLAYAVATHLNPEVLLVDEVLAVGDLAFQRKCFHHMQRYLASGGSLVFVSHSPHQMQSVCQRGLLLEHGRLAFSGTAVDAVNYYYETQHRIVPGPDSSSRNTGLDEDHPVAILGLTVHPGRGEEIRTGKPLHLVLHYRALDTILVNWGFSIWTGDHWVCVTGGLDLTSRTLRAGEGELTCVIQHLPLAAGSYAMRAALLDPTTHLPLALLGWEDSAHPFTVRGDASTVNNALAVLNQLVWVDIEWA